MSAFTETAPLPRLHVSTAVQTAPEESHPHAWMVPLLPLCICFPPGGDRDCLHLKHWGRACFPSLTLLHQPVSVSLHMVVASSCLNHQRRACPLWSGRYQHFLALAPCYVLQDWRALCSAGQRRGVHTAQLSIQAQSCLIYTGLYYDVTLLRSAAFGL